MNEEIREEETVTGSEAAAEETTAPAEGTTEEAAPVQEGITFTLEQVEQMELAVKQLESVKEQFVRLTAEYENYRKRTAREKETLYGDAKIDTVKEFLAVYDNLERACAASGSEDDPHFKGLQMIFTQYQGILAKLGVEKMDCVGQPFDPEKQNAVMHIDNEELGENTVAQVLQAGFTMNGRVLRHAMVQVAN